MLKNLCLVTFRFVSRERFSFLEDCQALDGRRDVNDQGGDLDRGQYQLHRQVANMVSEEVGDHVARVLEGEPGVLRVPKRLQNLAAPLFECKCKDFFNITPIACVGEFRIEF